MKTLGSGGEAPRKIWPVLTSYQKKSLLQNLQKKTVVPHLSRGGVRLVNTVIPQIDDFGFTFNELVGRRNM